nr:hypothetical protein [Burkholderia sp. BCC1644]
MRVIGQVRLARKGAAVRCFRIANLVVHRAVQRRDRTATAPALAIVWITGIAIALRGYWFGVAWLSVKLAVAAALSALPPCRPAALSRCRRCTALHGALRRMERDDLVVVPTPWLGPAAVAVVAATALVVGLAVIKPFRRRAPKPAPSRPPPASGAGSSRFPAGS